MNDLPAWAQITMALLGVTNISTIVLFVFTYRQKNRELKDAKLQRLNDNLLKNTQPHIDTLYIPIIKILAKMESQYDEYKSAKARCLGYEVKKRLEIPEGKPGDQARIDLELLLHGNKHEAIFALVADFQFLKDYQEKMIEEGSISYLTKEFEKRLDSFIRFLYGVNIVIQTYMLPLQEVPKQQPRVFVLGTSEFEKEFYTEIDFFHSYIRELALGTTDTIQSLSKKNS
jgi:hypothetical protein